jgi:hypothetical protein
MNGIWRQSPGPHLMWCRDGKCNETGWKLSSLGSWRSEKQEGKLCQEAAGREQKAHVGEWVAQYGHSREAACAMSSTHLIDDVIAEPEVDDLPHLTCCIPLSGLYVKLGCEIQCGSEGMQATVKNAYLASLWSPQALWSRAGSRQKGLGFSLCAAPSRMAVLVFQSWAELSRDGVRAELGAGSRVWGSETEVGRSRSQRSYKDVKTSQECRGSN